MAHQRSCPAPGSIGDEDHTFLPDPARFFAYRTVETSDSLKSDDARLADDEWNSRRIANSEGQTLEGSPCIRVVQAFQNAHTRCGRWLQPLTVVSESMEEEHKQRVQQFLRSGFPEEERCNDRAVACMLGMACGDALGCTVEFSNYTPNTPEKDMLRQIIGGGAFQQQPGQWTDDAAMGFCIAESLLAHGGVLDPLDLKLRFIAWWHLGYCSCSDSGAVGLGGQIGTSLRSFVQSGETYSMNGSLQGSGNGSVMRLAAIPIAFSGEDEVEQAMHAATVQSLTTHRGVEARECARLATFICHKGFHSEIENENENENGNENEDCSEGIDLQLPENQESGGSEGSANHAPNARVQAVLGDLSTFDTNEASVRCLADSLQEPAEEGGDHDLDRNWNWKSANFTYAPGRSRPGTNTGYVGSYIMDGLAMALHCVWTTNSFEDAIIKAVNKRGDADTVGAITGQIAGAIYGCQGIPQQWLKAIQTWDADGRIALRAYLLATKTYPEEARPSKNFEEQGASDDTNEQVFYQSLVIDLNSGKSKLEPQEKEENNSSKFRFWRY